MVHFESVDGQDLDLKVARAAFEPERTSAMLNVLCSEVGWRQDEISMFGKTNLVPRLTAWHGDPDTTYTYSNIKLDPLPWSNELTAVRAEVEQLCAAEFNSVLLNRYRDGADSMGWHSDDEPELGDQPLIASLSLGASRRFRFRRKDNHRTTINLDLGDGDLLVMSGETQSFWAHQIPKTAAVVGERINLTFRRIQPH